MTHWHNHTLIVCLCLLIGSFAQAEEAKVKKPVQKFSKSLEVNYGNTKWNGSAKNIDSAFAYIKDKKTGKVVKVILDETAPDSSTFSGKFSVDLGGNAIKPEVYIPPHKTTKSEQDMFNFNKLLSEGKIKRKPLLMKKSESGGYSLDVYDNKQQVLDAAKAYKEERRIKKAQASKIKPIADKTVIETARLASKQALLEKLALEAVARERERLRSEQLEKQRIEELREQQKMMAAAEIQRRKALAAKIAKKALKAYSKGKYKKAEKLFRKSSELDPNNNSFIFKYAVTQYRNKKYNEALVLFKLANTQGTEDIEKNYFMGLTHYRLKELKPALSKFDNVIKAKHELMSPSAAFYAGMIQYSQEDYKPATNNFEYVLDASKDPKLDQRAEDMIEKIARILMFKRKQDNPNTAGISIGASYDSNVLYASDSSIQQGLATAIATPRYNLTANYERRFVYTQTHEFNAKVSSYYDYSQDAEAASSDAFLTTIMLPYKYKGRAFRKGYLLSVSTGFEALYMGIDSASVRENILNTSILSIDNTFVLKDNWFSAFTLELRSDDSRLSLTSADDDADALKYTISTTQTYFLDQSNKKGILAKLGYTGNNAVGKDKTYGRSDLGVTYIDFVPSWDSSWTAGVSYYHLKYAEASSRTDSNVTVSSSLSKPFKSWIGGVNASYVMNNSSIDANSYNKYVIMATASWEWIF